MADGAGLLLARASLQLARAGWRATCESGPAAGEGGRPLQGSPPIFCFSVGAFEPPWRPCPLEGQGRRGGLGPRAPRARVQVPLPRGLLLTRAKAEGKTHSSQSGGQD